MMYSDPVGGQGLLQDVDDLCDTTSASYPTTAKTRNINAAYSNVNRLIWEVADGWQFDDSNQTDFPIAKTDLVNNQQNYALPSTAQRIERIEVKDLNGDWLRLKQLDINDVDTSINEFEETAGMPVYYDLIGSSLFLYPTPSSAYVTTSEGLEVFFGRDMVMFTTASTTATPGFAAPFHRILSLSASIDYERDPSKLGKFIRDKEDLVKGLKNFYSHRNIERRSAINPDSKKYWRQYL